jgi:hypothetical protein
MTTQNPVIRLAGIVIGSPEPERLAEWYRAGFTPQSAPSTASGRPTVELSAGRILFDRRDDVAASAVEPGRVLVNLLIEDIRAVEAQLNTLHPEWIRPVTAVPSVGFIGTLIDPDGNYVQLMQRTSQPEPNK